MQHSHLAVLQAAAAVGAFSVVHELINSAAELQLNTNAKDFASGIMRKLGGAGAPSSELEKLFVMERELRGTVCCTMTSTVRTIYSTLHTAYPVMLVMDGVQQSEWCKYYASAHRHALKSHMLICSYKLHANVGENTHMAAHELSRVYRREENMQGVRALLQQVRVGHICAGGLS